MDYWLDGILWGGIDTPNKEGDTNFWSDGVMVGDQYPESWRPMVIYIM